MPPICKALLKICTVHLTPVCGRYLCVAGMDTLDRDRIHDFSRGTIHIYDLHQHVGDGLLRLRSGSAKQSVPGTSVCPVHLYQAKSLVPCKQSVPGTIVPLQRHLYHCKVTCTMQSHCSQYFSEYMPAQWLHQHGASRPLMDAAPSGCEKRPHRH